MSLDSRRQRDLLRLVAPPLLAVGLVLVVTHPGPVDTSGDWPTKAARSSAPATPAATGAAATTRGPSGASVAPHTAVTLGPPAAAGATDIAHVTP